jgi:Ulp1 family protease
MTMQQIYVPIKTTGGHWFLMIVHLEQGIIYHLDTYCPVECAELRKMRIKRAVYNFIYFNIVLCCDLKKIL